MNLNLYAKFNNSEHPDILFVGVHKLLSSNALNDYKNELDKAKWVCFCDPKGGVEYSVGGFGRLVEIARKTKSKFVYSDYYKFDKEEVTKHRLIDCQQGSVRDDFDLGPLFLCNAKLVRDTLNEFTDLKYSVLYAIRLRAMRQGAVLHVPECLYESHIDDAASISNGQFDYVDPKNREVQLEMEAVLTQHLHAIKAHIDYTKLKNIEAKGKFPVDATVVIPVRNRVKTIADAINSVLSQKFDGTFNVIVVDNASTDGTSEVVAALAKHDKRVVYRHFDENDNLEIGGCWMAAINDPCCGRYAIQLDSDDIYSDENVISQIVSKFREEKCAMVIGSYSIVDFKLKPLPPFTIDHREWTDENGVNNALRINGLGAPRAFVTSLVRKHPIPNVSYGEDYAIGLRLSREYKIGRIFTPLYLCRRWEGNSDAALSNDRVNANNYYKDSIRSIEILSRKK